MQRLLDEQEFREERLQRLVRAQRLPELPEFGEGLELLIAIQSEREVLSAFRLQDVRNSPQPLGVVSEVAVHLELEVPQAIHADVRNE